MSIHFKSCSERVAAHVGCLLALTLAACATADDTPSVEPDGRSQNVSDGGATEDDAPGADIDSTLGRALAACAALGGDAPGRISDVVARINQLPEPASIPCLIASLPRPLSLVATRSTISAQPAAGPNSPRLFVMLDGLTLSVVGDGVGQQLLEFGEWVTPLRTLKAELSFPVARPLSDDAPHHLLYMGGPLTTCSFCHPHEEPHPTIPSAYVSDALRPRPGQELPIGELRKIRTACTTQSGAEAPPHCVLMRALFDYGEVRQGAFDNAVQAGF